METKQESVKDVQRVVLAAKTFRKERRDRYGAESEAEADIRAMKAALKAIESQP